MNLDSVTGLPLEDPGKHDYVNVTPEELSQLSQLMASKSMYVNLAFTGSAKPVDDEEPGGTSAYEDPLTLQVWCCRSLAFAPCSCPAGSRSPRQHRL